MEAKLKSIIHDMNDVDKEFVNALETHKTGENQSLMFNVSNNYVGRTFIKMVRKALNRDTYEIRVKGSQSDRISYSKERGIRLGSDCVPLQYADRLRVYIDGVPTHRTPWGKEIVTSNAKLRLANESLASELSEAKEKIELNKKTIDNYERKFRKYILADELRGTQVISFAQQVYKENGSKLAIIRHLMKSNGLGLIDAKNVCELLIF